MIGHLVYFPKFSTVWATLKTFREFPLPPPEIEPKKNWLNHRYLRHAHNCTWFCCLVIKAENVVMHVPPQVTE